MRYTNNPAEEAIFGIYKIKEEHETMNFKIKNLCQKAFKTFQANIRLDEDVLKMS